MPQHIKFVRPLLSLSGPCKHRHLLHRASVPLFTAVSQKALTRKVARKVSKSACETWRKVARKVSKSACETWRKVILHCRMFSLYVELIHASLFRAIPAILCHFLGCGARETDLRVCVHCAYGEESRRAYWSNMMKGSGYLASLLNI